MPRTFKSQSQKSRPAFLLLAAALGIVACYELSPTGPTQRRLPTALPRRVVTPLPPTEKALGPTPYARVFITTYPFPEQIVVEGKITGTVEITSDPLARWQVIGLKDYRGYSQSTSLGTQCDVSASFAWGNSASPSQPCSGGNPASSWLDTIRVMDSVWGVRGPPIQESTGQCGVGVACHTYPSASTILTLTPLAASLKYTASLPFLAESQMTATYPYAAVRFLGIAEPGTLGAFATPKRFLQRAWHKADPSVGPPNTDVNGYCPPSILVCDLYVRESGIFWGKERVNGVEQSDSVAINCFSGDSLMDFLEARRAYMDIMDSSHADAAYQSDRREHVLAIVEDSLGVLHAVQIPTTSADQCSSSYTSLSPGDGFGKIRAYVHTHPYKPYEFIQCAGGSTLDAARPGLSDTDYKYMKQSNQYIQTHYSSSGWTPVPWYAMDKTNVYRLKPGQRLTESTKPQNTFKWKSGRCKWARPTNSQVPGWFY